MNARELIARLKRTPGKLQVRIHTMQSVIWVYANKTDVIRTLSQEPQEAETGLTLVRAENSPDFCLIEDN